MGWVGPSIGDSCGFPYSERSSVSVPPYRVKMRADEPIQPPCDRESPLPSVSFFSFSLPLLLLVAAIPDPTPSPSLHLCVTTTIVLLPSSPLSRENENGAH